MRILTISLLGLLVAASEARGQSSVSDCSLVADPTLQRTCVENFKQGGKARGLNAPVLDDGSVPKLRGGRPAIPVVRTKRGGGKGGSKAAAPKGAAPAEDAPTEMP